MCLVILVRIRITTVMMLQEEISSATILNTKNNVFNEMSSKTSETLDFNNAMQLYNAVRMSYERDSAQLLYLLDDKHDGVDIGICIKVKSLEPNLFEHVYI